MASVGFLLFRSAFALGEQIAPQTAGRLAFALFCRTGRGKNVSAREREAISAARPFMDGARHHRLDTPSGCVAAHEFRPARSGVVPTVLVIHGWRSRTEHMRGIIEALLGQGFRVIALDLPGHGASAGRSLNMALAVKAVRAVADWFGPFAAVVGHSFGGAVALNAVAGSVRGAAPIEAHSLVLVSAPSSMPALFEDFGRFLRLGARTQMALAGEVARVAGAPLESFVGGDQLRTLSLPTLAVHAPDDREVAFSEAQHFEAAGPHVELLRAPGKGHRRILADTAVAEAIARFVGERAFA